MSLASFCNFYLCFKCMLQVSCELVGWEASSQAVAEFSGQFVTSVAERWLLVEQYRYFRKVW